MDLQRFLAEILIQITKGIRDAQAGAEKNDALVNPDGMYFGNADATQANHTFVGQPDTSLWWHSRYVNPAGLRIGQLVDFEVSVVVTETDQVKVGVGIFAGPVGVGSQGHMEDKSSSMSRIKFSVPVFLPVQTKK